MCEHTLAHTHRHSHTDMHTHSSHQSLRRPQSIVYNSSSLEKCTNFKNKLSFFFFFKHTVYTYWTHACATSFGWPREAGGGERLPATDANFKKIRILNRCSAVTYPNPLVVSTIAPQYGILWSVCYHRRAPRHQEEEKVQIIQI